MAQTTLWSLIPDPKVLSALESDQLAHAVMTCLRSSDQDSFNLYNLGLEGFFTGGYPPESRDTIDKVIAGAWSYLQGRGYLGQKPGAHDSSFVVITPQGERWHSNNHYGYYGVPPTSSSQSLPSRPWGPDELAKFTDDELHRTMVESQPGSNDWELMKAELDHRDRKRQPNGKMKTVVDLPENAFRLLFAISTHSKNSSSPVFVTDLGLDMDEQAAKTAWEYLRDRDLIRTYNLPYSARINSNGTDLLAKSSTVTDLSNPLKEIQDQTVQMGEREQVRERDLISSEEPETLPSTSHTPTEEVASDSTVTSQTQTGQNVGPSTHVARDKWTIDDALGYYPYAYAIYRFLTDRETASPLAISIQAPWGGGKTSLMRMIQAQLDPENPSFQGEKTAGFADQQTSATVKQIDDVIQAGSLDQKPEQIDAGTIKNRITVWFNAWKYESTDQIWAGLADSIVKQVTERLSPVERELFFFRLHLKRINVGKIRKKITDGVLSKLYELLVHWWWLYLVIPVTTYYIQHWTLVVTYVPSISAITQLGGILDIGLLVCHAILARKKNLSTPAKIEFGDLVKAPDYDVNLGFIHQVAEDLRITLELVNVSSRPLVIFIDDLDRCSPGKVSAVVEAINLFLAGEFEHCIFVLGIDDEVVAAALNKAHSDVFAQMPVYARATSIGWRFMDKFVQLPFIMPPPTPTEMANYTHSLLTTKDKKGKLTLKARQQVAASVEEDQTGKSIEAIVEGVNQALQLDPAQKQELTKDAATIAKMNMDIKEFTDDEEGIIRVIQSGIQNFSRNPRDVKRFINSFRFYYFLRSALLARQADAPSVDQLSRWILLSLRWPTIVRWLRSTESDSKDPKNNGLAKLVKIVEESKDKASWEDGVAILIGLDEKDRTLISDEQLFTFFKGEYELPEMERLSFSIGKGLW